MRIDPRRVSIVNVCWNGGRHGGAPEGTSTPAYLPIDRAPTTNPTTNTNTRFCHPSLTSTAPSQTPCIQQQKRQRMEQMKKLGIGKFENQV